MTRRGLGVSIVAFAMIAGMSPAAARTRKLTSAAEILGALSAGKQVRAVFHYKAMKLVDDEGEERTAPDATGGMAIDPWEYFAAGVVGNPVGYLATSHAQLIRHPRHGYVLNYLKVSIYDNGQVKIVAQYLTPMTYEVKMDETFTTDIANGKNKSGAEFFVID